MKLLRRHRGRASVRSSSLAPSEVLRQARGNAHSKYQRAASDWLWAYAVCNAGTKAYSFEQVKEILLKSCRCWFIHSINASFSGWKKRIGILREARVEFVSFLISGIAKGLWNKDDRGVEWWRCGDGRGGAAARSQS